jgi:hypothetical protein
MKKKEVGKESPRGRIEKPFVANAQQNASAIPDDLN